MAGGTDADAYLQFSPSCAPSSVASCWRAVTPRTCWAINTAGFQSMLVSASKHTTAPRWSDYCATVPAHPSPWIAFANRVLPWRTAAQNSTASLELTSVVPTRPPAADLDARPSAAGFHRAPAAVAGAAHQGCLKSEAIFRRAAPWKTSPLGGKRSTQSDKRGDSISCANRGGILDSRSKFDSRDGQVCSESIECIQWTGSATRRHLEHMGVDHRGGNV